jgi:flagella basal body P-ring formation protein FlgA
MTRPISAAPIVALVIASLCVPGWAAGSPSVVRLKAEAAVAGDVITVADVAELSEGVPAEAAGLVLGNAPWPGHERVISRALVRIRLVSAGIRTDRILFDGSELCAVTRQSVRISGDQIVAAARAHLESCLPPCKGAEVQIELLRQVAPVDVAKEGGVPELRPKLCGSVASGKVRVEVDVVREGLQIRKVLVGFVVKRWQTVAVARRRISPGEKLDKGNAALMRREVGSVAGTCIADLDEFSGKVARSMIPAGRIITARSLREPDPPWVLEYNQHVLLIVQSGSLRVICHGKSTCRARKGETARARNLTTGREVVGVAVDDSTIQVIPGGGNDG